jgi:hypothetical protein
MYKKSSLIQPRGCSPIKARPFNDVFKQQAVYYKAEDSSRNYMTET